MYFLIFQCRYEEDQECTTVNEEICSNTFEEQCAEVLEEQCETIEEEQCISVTEEDCQTSYAQVRFIFLERSFNVFGLAANLAFKIFTESVKS